jgi:hypothetical protein
MSRTKKAPFPANTQIACVSIDFRTYLLPLPKALKVLELMGGAVPCDRQYLRRDRYVVSSDKCPVELAIVSHDQIEMPQGTVEHVTPALGYDHGN